MVPDPKSPVSPLVMNVIFPWEMGSPLYLTVPETSPVGKVRGPPDEQPEKAANPRMQVQTSQLRRHLVTEPQVKGIVTSRNRNARIGRPLTQSASEASPSPRLRFGLVSQSSISISMTWLPGFTSRVRGVER